jgi:hypothetical protein
MLKLAFPAGALWRGRRSRGQLLRHPPRNGDSCGSVSVPAANQPGARYGGRVVATQLGTRAENDPGTAGAAVALNVPPRIAEPGAGATESRRSSYRSLSHWMSSSFPSTLYIRFAPRSLTASRKKNEKCGGGTARAKPMADAKCEMPAVIPC